MLAYKESNENDLNQQRYFIDSTGKEQSDQIKIFRDHYQQIFLVNPTESPQIFCSKLVDLTHQIEKLDEKFGDYYELHDYNLFKSVVGLLSCENYDVVFAVLTFLNKLLQFKGKIRTTLFETPIVLRCIEIFSNHPGTLTPILLQMFTSICSKEIHSSDPNMPDNEGFNRIFSQITIVQINNILIQSLRNDVNLNENEVNSIFSIFLYEISSFELQPDIQEFILNYISRQYNNENDYNYYHNIWTLSKMSNHQNSFPIIIFFQKQLHKFVIDMINNEKDKIIYPALNVVYQISKINISPDIEIPKIQSNLDKRIFLIATSHNPDGIFIYKESTRLAAFRALKSMITTIQYFQRTEQSSIEFVLETICGKEKYEDQVLRNFINFFNCSSFKMKNTLIEFITQFIISGSAVRGSLFIQFLINNGIIQVLFEAIESQDEFAQMQGIIAMRKLIKESKKHGCDGLFEIRAIELVNIEVIDDIIDNADDKVLSRKANVLRSKLRHLPNRLFCQDIESDNL